MNHSVVCRTVDRRPFQLNCWHSVCGLWSIDWCCHWWLLCCCIGHCSVQCKCVQHSIDRRWWCAHDVRRPTMMWWTIAVHSMWMNWANCSPTYSANWVQCEWHCDLNSYHLTVAGIPLKLVESAVPIRAMAMTRPHSTFSHFPNGQIWFDWPMRPLDLRMVFPALGWAVVRLLILSKIPNLSTMIWTKHICRWKRWCHRVKWHLVAFSFRWAIAPIRPTSMRIDCHPVY